MRLYRPHLRESAIAATMALFTVPIAKVVVLPTPLQVAEQVRNDYQRINSGWAKDGESSDSLDFGADSGGYVKWIDEKNNYSAIAHTKTNDSNTAFVAYKNAAEDTSVFHKYSCERNEEEKYECNESGIIKNSEGDEQVLYKLSISEYKGLRAINKIRRHYNQAISVKKMSSE